MQNGKGSSRRIEDKDLFDKGYERIFVLSGHCCKNMKKAVDNKGIKFKNGVYKYSGKVLEKCPFCDDIINK